MKKGQLTIFIVLGIVLIAAVSAMILLKGELMEAYAGIEKGEAIRQTEEAAEVTAEVESCIKENAEMAQFLALYYGGKKDLAEGSTITFLERKVPIYYDKGISYVPTKKEVEDVISYYISQYMLLCLEDFNPETYEIEIMGAPSAETAMKDSSLDISVSYPIRIISNNSSETVRRFFVTADSPVDKVYNDAIAIYNMAEQAKPYSEMASFSAGKGFELASDTHENAAIFVLIYPELKLNSYMIEYPFALLYEEEQPYIGEEEALIEEQPREGMRDLSLDLVSDALFPEEEDDE
ncbi:MAG: hypothetical protein ABIB71_06610 [Candidatus Woesearchaeota archaeon]